MRQDTMSSGSGVKYTLPANLDLKYHTKKVFHLLSLNKQIFLVLVYNSAELVKRPDLFATWAIHFCITLCLALGCWRDFIYFLFQTDRERQSMFRWWHHTCWSIQRAQWRESGLRVWYLPGLQLYHSGLLQSGE